MAMSYEKFNLAFMLAAEPIPGVGYELYMETFASALVCVERPMTNVRTQWDIDPQSLIDGAIDELRDCAEWIKQVAAKDQETTAERRASFRALRRRLLKMLADKDIKATLHQHFVIVMEVIDKTE